jgi:hypothetical protein
MMNNLLWEYMKKNGMVTGDVGKDRRAFIALNSMGDIDRYEIPLNAELEMELPEHLQLSHSMGEEEYE